MRQQQQFEIKDNVNLIFQSKGKLYQLRLIITDGLIFLKQLEENKEHTERVIFIDEKTKEHVMKPKKKRKKKNLATNNEK